MRLPAIFLVFFVLVPASCMAMNDIDARLDPLVANGSVALEKDGSLLVSRNLDIPLVPASILKIATALAALELLGPEHSFQTFFYVTPENDLLIRGTGDPFLVSEHVANAARQLKKKGVDRVRSILVDDSFFALSGPASGAGSSDNPYDASNSALAVNFNTVAIIRSSADTVASAEPQTPDLPLMRELALPPAPGEYRINVTANEKYGPGMGLRYAGELFRALLLAQGVEVSGEISRGRAQAGDVPVHVHQSPPLSAMIPAFMRYSNNFIANQLFLVSGARVYGGPATWDKGRRAVNGFFQEKLGFCPESFHMEEGSGLSRKNRVTARTMLELLAAFEKYSSLLPAEKGLRIKSGTLAGVFSYAGYLEKNNRMHRVVIILNQKKNTRDAILEIFGDY